MQPILDEFAALLDRRLRAGAPTSEDSIRYTFFAALVTAGGLAPEEVVLEYPHPAIPRAKIDTWLPEYQGSAVAIEFKYDRDLPGGRNIPRTQKAGALFKDLYRLVQVIEQTGARGLFVYVTNAQMASYLANPQNGLNGFYELVPGAMLRIDSALLRSRAQTFRNAVGTEFTANITGKLQAALADQHALRIYEVAPD